MPSKPENYYGYPMGDRDENLPDDEHPFVDSPDKTEENPLKQISGPKKKPTGVVKHPTSKF